MKNIGFPIALIRPASVITKDSVSSNFGVPALSLAYLAGALERADIPYQVIDAQGEGLDEFHPFRIIEGIELILRGLNSQQVITSIKEDTEILAVTCMFSNEWIYVRELIKDLLIKFPGKPILIGGEHATANPEQILNDLPSEHILCILGEGEENLVEIHQKISSGHSYDDLNSVVFRKEGRIIHKPRRERIKDIDSLRPCWDKVPLTQYMDKGYSYGAHNLRSMPMLFSRGCPYQCTFCTSPSMWGTRWIHKSAQMIEGEIAEAISKYQAEHIDFFDLTLVINKNAILELSKVIKKFNISWAMPSGTRSEVLDEEVLKSLKESGVVRITYAPESGSKDTLKKIKKRVNLDKMTKSIKKAHQLGICTRATLIFGFPDQTLKDCFQSVAYGIKLAFYGLDDLACYPFVPYCGSELFDQLILRGDLKNRDMAEFQAIHIYNRARGMKSYSTHIPNWMMPVFVLGLMAIFYSASFLFRPHRLFLMIKNLILRTPVTGFDLLVRGIFIKKWHLLINSLKKWNTSK